MAQKQSAQQLIEKYLNGTCSEEEKKLVENFYFKQFKTRQASPPNVSNDVKAAMWARIAAETTPAKTKQLWNNRRIWSAAACLLLLASSGYFLITKYKATDKPAFAFESNLGQRKSIKLPDGTLVMLNAGSKLTLAPGYNEKNREVRLTGEAYFTVKHNSKVPFIVYTPAVTVRDIGTVFNVKAYPADKIFEATLISGIIELTPQHSSDKVVLAEPNKKFIYSDAQPQIESSKPALQSVHNAPYQVTQANNTVFKNTVVETDWTKGKLTFYNENFATLVPILERWYNVHLVVNNHELTTYSFTATFTNETIEEALNVLKQTTDFNYRKEGNVITIY